MTYLQVNNETWESFVHYKTGKNVSRIRHWIQFPIKILDDYYLLSLPDETKAHLLLIWLLAAKFDNKIPNDVKFIQNRIGSTSEINLNLLLEMKFLVEIDSDGKEVIRNILSDSYQNPIKILSHITLHNITEHNRTYVPDANAPELESAPEKKTVDNLPGSDMLAFMLPDSKLINRYLTMRRAMTSNRSLVAWLPSCASISEEVI